MIAALSIGLVRRLRAPPERPGLADAFTLADLFCSARSLHVRPPEKIIINITKKQSKLPCEGEALKIRVKIRDSL